MRDSSTAPEAAHLALVRAGAAAALVALWLLQVFPALSLARRLDSDQREREALLRRAIEASDAERRRIAADLHDGVVQDLAGISLGLAARAERAQGEEAAALRSAARRHA